MKGFTVKNMQTLIYLVSISILFASCSTTKTVFISNRLGKPLTLQIDTSFDALSQIAFKDSLDGLKIIDKKVIVFGKGKWTKDDKTDLEKLLLNTKVIINEHNHNVLIPFDVKLNHISLNVEELCLQIKYKKR